MHKVLYFILVVVSLNAEIALASVIVWDQSPDGIGGTLTGASWSNISDRQNFGDKITFGNSTIIKAIDVYMRSDVGRVGDEGIVRIWNETFELQHEFLVVISEVGNEGASNFSQLHRVYGDFNTDIFLNAGITYFVGFSGFSTTWLQAGFSGGSGYLLDNAAARFDDDVFISTSTAVGDIAFRLHGTTLSVSSPTLIILLYLCSLAFCLYRFKQRF